MEPNHRVAFKDERSTGAKKRVVIDDISICGSSFSRMSAEVLCRCVSSDRGDSAVLSELGLAD